MRERAASGAIERLIFTIAIANLKAIRAILGANAAKIIKRALGLVELALNALKLLRELNRMLESVEFNAKLAELKTTLIFESIG